MNIAIIGTGYVGLPTGIGFASLGHNVTCIDKDELKINQLKNKKVTLYEDGLEDLFNRVDIEFTTSIPIGVKNADLIIIAVGTPQDENTGKANLTYIYNVAKELSECKFDKYTVIATKSTVPVGTGDKIEEIINNKNCDIISLPEFLREGKALYDFFNPDRIICGSSSEMAKGLIADLYPTFDVLFTDRRSAELIKYASNAFLATKIHYINEMANLCEAVGANINMVAKGMGLDKRIGDKFLKAGIGYGGSCFPKDTLAITHLAKDYNIDLTIIQATILGNLYRKVDIAKKIMKYITPVSKVAILGLAFKNDTDDCRQSPAIDITKILVNEGYNIHVFDYKALKNAEKILGKSVTYHDNIKSITKDADICIILTEWEQFKFLDWKTIKEDMKNPLLLDYRNLLSKEYMESLGFIYKGVGI